MRTIAAIATPLFNSPIHIIRISGPDAFDIINKILKEPIKPIPNSIQRNVILENNQNVDDVLLNVFVNPKSYTGEDLVEINCHGNVLITKKILQLLILAGAQYANPGEFSMQALINQKMNYSQIEATNNLINTKSEKGCKLAINAVLGLSEQKIKALRDQLFQITGSIEVNIDYPEYDDVPKYTNEQIINLIEPIKNELITIYHNSIKVQPIFAGFKIAIIGKPNVGKSSLLNLLSKQDKAIVSNIEGTTRDVIESDIVMNGINIRLIDTAGIRQADNEIESIGINKSLDQIQKADLVLYLKDAHQADENDLLTAIGQKDYLEVFNKSDLKKVPNKINISVANNDINQLLKALEDKLALINYQDINNEVLQSSRQLMICDQIINSLNQIQNDINDQIPLDMVQTLFEQVIGLFNELLGISFEYDKLDELFKNFCLGK